MAPEHVAAVPRLPWHQQFWLVLRIQYSDYRDSAPFIMLFSLVMPLGLLWMLGTFMAGRGAEAAWFLAGNAVMTVSFGSANFSLFRVGQLRLNKELDYYATLPIHKGAFMATLFVLSQLSALPGLLTSLVAGHLLLDISARAVLTALPLTLLAGVTLTLVAAWVGSLARTWGHLNLYGNLIYFVVMFLSPVLVPVERLIAPLRVTAYLLPTGQAAMAIREALEDQFGLRFWALCGALVLWALVAGLMSLRGLDWRSD